MVMVLVIVHNPSYPSCRSKKSNNGIPCNCDIPSCPVIAARGCLVEAFGSEMPAAGPWRCAPGMIPYILRDWPNGGMLIEAPVAGVAGAVMGSPASQSLA